MFRVRILITGITGFVGSHLTEFALARGAAVIGALRWRSKTEHIERIRDQLTLVESDRQHVATRLQPIGDNRGVGRKALSAARTDH